MVKKILCILSIVIGILLIIISLYFFFNIYFVVKNINGITYDGFGYELIYQSPSDPHTIWAYALFFLGCSLIDYPRKVLIKLRDKSIK